MEKITAWPGIEHGKRRVGLGGGFLVALHRAVVADRLARLGAEILHGLVVEKRIDRLGIGVGVGFVHAAADRDAPFGGLVRVGQIDHHHGENDRRIGPVEFPREDAEHEAELEDGRQQRQHHQPRQFLDPLAAALQHAGEPAGLALEMEAQGKAMHVLEGLERELSHRMHRHLGEQPVAHLRQHRHEHAGETVEDRQQDGRAPEPVAGRGGLRGDIPAAARHRHQRVGSPFEGERRHHGDALGDEQQAERHEDTPLKIRASVGPQIGPQFRDGRQKAGRVECVRGFCGRRRWRGHGLSNPFLNMVPTPVRRSSGDIMPVCWNRLRSVSLGRSRPDPSRCRPCI